MAEHYWPASAGAGAGAWRSSASSSSSVRAPLSVRPLMIQAGKPVRRASTHSCASRTSCAPCAHPSWLRTGTSGRQRLWGNQRPTAAKARTATTLTQALTLRHAAALRWLCLQG